MVGGCVAGGCVVGGCVVGGCVLCDVGGDVVVGSWLVVGF